MRPISLRLISALRSDTVVRRYVAPPLTATEREPMTTDLLESRLQAAIAPHDLLQHPFYRAWSMGQLTLGDLGRYAGQYRAQVDALPALLSAAQAQTRDAATIDALAKNHAEEIGAAAPVGIAGATDAVPHKALWLDFAAGIGASRAQVESAPADGETQAAVAQLHGLVAEGELASLAALYTYEAQTARVSTSKREGLCAFYGVKDPQTVAFFSAHEGLDVHHAHDLLSGLSRAVQALPVERREAAVEQACDAAKRAAQAQWLFLDGVQARRMSAAA
jgi:pyrroloquinoline-quinone synthase